MIRRIILVVLLLCPAAAQAIPPVMSSTATLELNSAPPAALMTLPGIGPRRAQAIVEARKRRPFRFVRELLRIKGIGVKTLKRIRPRLRVERKQSGPRRRPRLQRAATRPGER